MNSYQNIYLAAQNDKLDELKNIIASNCIDEWKLGTYFFSALTQLALEKNLHGLQCLLHCGANIQYAIYGAAIGGHIDLVKELLKNGGNINYAIRGAAVAGNLDLVRYLFNLGANLNAAVNGAAIGGHRELVELLLSWDASIHSAAHGAGIGNHQDLAKILLKREANINDVAHGAAISGQVAWVEELLKQGADLHHIAHAAAMGGHINWAKKLYALGAPLIHIAHGAARGGHFEWVKALLKEDPNLLDDLAHGAAMGGHGDLLRYLLEKGANIHYAVNGAALNGHKNLVESLLKKGANIHSAAEGAALNGHKVLVDYLLSNGAHINDITKYAIEGRQILNNKMKQLYYLSFYQHNLIPFLCNSFDYLNKIPHYPPTENIVINNATMNRSIANSKHIHFNNLNYFQALTRTDPECNGMLYLLMCLTMKNHIATTPELLPEIWLRIFNFTTPLELNVEDVKSLGFLIGRTYLLAQLSCYIQNGISHTGRARSFFKAISTTKNKAEIQNLISKQASLLHGKNPYPLFERNNKYKTDLKNPTTDKYNDIVNYWNTELLPRKP